MDNVIRMDYNFGLNKEQQKFIEYVIKKDDCYIVKFKGKDEMAINRVGSKGKVLGIVTALEKEVKEIKETKETKEDVEQMKMFKMTEDVFSKDENEFEDFKSYIEKFTSGIDNDTILSIKGSRQQYREVRRKAEDMGIPVYSVLNYLFYLFLTNKLLN